MDDDDKIAGLTIEELVLSIGVAFFGGLTISSFVPMPWDLALCLIWGWFFGGWISNKTKPKGPPE